MVFDKEELLYSLDEPKEEPVKHLAPDGLQYLERDGEVESRNRIADFRSFVSQQEARDITYLILPSLRDAGGTCFDGWEQAVRDAAQAYNNLAGVKINFREITRNELPDITIGCDNDPYFNTSVDRRDILFNIRGNARARISGHDRKPGKYISINNTSNKTEKTGVMIHEFGHTLGFNHTNTNDGVQITCGGRYEHTYDPNESVFRTSVNRNNMDGTDIRSIRHLWPENLEQPVDGTVERQSNDWIKFKFRNPSSSNLYTEIVLAHSLNGNWEVARFWCDKPNHRGEYEILWYAPGLFTSGSQQFWVKGVSHAEEEGSNWCYLGGFNR